MTDSRRRPVIIAGGGPAGSVAALCLTRLGHDVVVLEKEKFPRYRLGESLLPGTLSILARLGVMDRIEAANFVRKRAATFLWGPDQEPWTFTFSTPRTAPWVYDHAYQVTRAEFDKILLDAARERGAEVREEHEVTDVRMEGNGGPVTVSWRNGDLDGSLRGDFVIDASGSRGIIARKMNMRRFDGYFRNMAVWSYYRGGRRFRGDLEGNIFSATFREGWIWIIPLKDDVYSVGAVVDQSASARMRAIGIETFYQECLERCPLAMEILAGATRSEKVRVIREWAYDASSVSLGRAFLCGDSACFIDPILSTGVTLAVNGALRAARAIRTGRAAPWLRGLAMDWYETEYRSIATDFADLAEHWYGGHADTDAWFWRAKKLADPTQNFSIRQAFIHLSAGVTGTHGAGGKLRSAGGYSPRQLELIYENLSTDLDAESQTSISEEEASFGTSPVRAHSATSVLLGRPRLRDAISFRPHMAEHDEILRPITRVTRVHPNAGPEHIELPIAALPVLERLDGRRSGLDIAADLRERYAGTPIEADLRDLVATTLTRLAETGAVDIA